MRADPTVLVGGERVDVVPAPRLPAAAVERVAAVPGVARAVGHITIPTSAGEGHGWPSPYALRSGRAPAGPRDVVADARLGAAVGERLRVVTPAGVATFRVTGTVDARGLFFTTARAQVLSGTPGRVDSIAVVAEPGTSPEVLRDRLRRPGLEVSATAADEHAEQRATLVGIFGTMAGIAGLVALFVVAGTFGLAIAQRRRETAVLRALGATPRQVRRLIAGEALIVSVVATGLGVVAGRPLASAISDVLIDRGVAPDDFAPLYSWIPLAAAFGLGIGIAQLAVVAAAHRAAKVRPAEALREVAVEHGRPGIVRVLTGVLCLAGGAAMAIIFTGEAASAFAILGAMLSASGVALLGRWLLGTPALVLAWPLRRLGAPGLLAATGLAANRWRSAALATPIVLIAMLVGTQAVLQASDQRNTEQVTAARTTAEHVVTGTVLPEDTAARLARLPGVEAVSGTLPTEVFLLDGGLSGWDTPWEAAGVDLAGAPRTLDPRVLRGDVRDVRGHAVAISAVVAEEGGVDVGDVLHARMADTRAATLRVAAVYERAAGLGHVLLDPVVARRHAAARTDSAVFVAGGPAAGRSLARYAAAHPGVEAMDRREYLDTVEVALRNDGTWGVWLVIGMALAFTALALVNTAAMATAERRGELATIRLLGGTPGQAMRMIALELVPIVAVALAAGGAIAAVALMGVPDGVRGIPLVVPAAVIAALMAGAALLAVTAGAVTARFALRVSPAEAMRSRE